MTAPLLYLDFTLINGYNLHYKNYKKSLRAEHGSMTEMPEAGTVFSKTNLILVCIHGSGNRGIYGKIVNFYLKEPVAFAGSADLILKMDLICDQLEETGVETDKPFLNCEMKQRFRRKHCGCLNVSAEYLLNRQSGLTYPEAMQAKELLTVSIDFRRNFSMQGRVRGRLTEGRYVCFRSALELLRMLEMIEIA